MSLKRKTRPSIEDVEEEEEGIVFPTMPVFPDMCDHDPTFHKGPNSCITPLPYKFVPPYPLRTKPKDNYDDVGAIFENI